MSTGPSAADRQRSQYPTAGRRILSFDEAREQTIVVGRYDAARLAVVRIDNSEALSAWAGEDVDAITGVRLPPGPIAFDEAMDLTKGNFPFWRDATAILVKTLVGQVVWIENQQAWVFDHDDRELRMRLHGQLTADRVQLLFGSSPILDKPKG